MSNADRSPCALLHQAFASATEQSAEATATVALSLWKSIEQQFAPLIGGGSVVMIFARSVELHKSVYPWLTLIPQAYAAPMPFIDHAADLRIRSRAEIISASCALVSTFTELLDHLIGNRLTSIFMQIALTSLAGSHLNQGTAP